MRGREDFYQYEILPKGGSLNQSLLSNETQDTMHSTQQYCRSIEQYQSYLQSLLGKCEAKAASGKLHNIDANIQPKQLLKLSLSLKLTLTYSDSAQKYAYSEGKRILTNLKKEIKKYKKDRSEEIYVQQLQKLKRKAEDNITKWLQKIAQEKNLAQKLMEVTQKSLFISSIQNLDEQSAQESEEEVGKDIKLLSKDDFRKYNYFLNQMDRQFLKDIVESAKDQMNDKKLEEAITYYEKQRAKRRKDAYYALGKLNYLGLYRQHEPQLCINMFQDAVSLGHKIAQLPLACIYFTGTNHLKQKIFSSNKIKSQYLFKRVAKIYPKTYAQFAQLLIEDKNYELALKYLEKGVKKEQPNCMFLLGELLCEGIHTNQNLSSGIKLIKASIKIEPTRANKIKYVFNCLYSEETQKIKEKFTAEEFSTMKKYCLQIISQIVLDTTQILAYIEYYGLCGQASENTAHFYKWKSEELAKKLI